MNRKLKVALAVAATVALSAVGALAAGTPSVSTGGATSITTGGAVVHGTVNPGGAKTGYIFQWGVTTAYGTSSKGRFVGSGTKPVSVHLSLHQLLPGTAYHYRIAALSRVGGAVGPDRTFTTKGHPPPTPVTGGVSSISTNSATVTGLVNPNGVATSWYVQYGLTTLYGLRTSSFQVPPGPTPVPVSALIQGLQSGKVFHYRIVAVNRGITETGNDAAFMTYPNPARNPHISATTRPSHDGTRPYTFTTSGHVHHPSWIPSTYACTQSVRVRYFFGGQRIGQKTAPVLPNCTFRATVSFRHLPRRATSRPVHLNVFVRFLGNGYLASDRANTNHVSEG
jgi:hypothetical protein